MHSPIQHVRPKWHYCADVHPDLAKKPSRTFLERNCSSGRRLAMTAHFSFRSVGRVIESAATFGFRFLGEVWRNLRCEDRFSKSTLTLLYEEGDTRCIDW